MTESQKPLSVIALDPGEKVGWARAEILPTMEWQDVRHGINHLKDMALGLDKGLSAYDVVIYETWRLRADKAREFSGSDFPSVQFIGMVRLLAWTNPSIKLVSQGPGVKKTARKTAPDWLNQIIENEPKSHDDAHNVDALLLLWHWTWRSYAGQNI